MSPGWSVCDAPAAPVEIVHRVADLLRAAQLRGARNGADRDRQRLDRRRRREVRPERRDLNLVAAAEVPQRDLLHLVDRRLVRRRVRRDLLEAALREVRVGVGLEVVGEADAGVRHDRRARAGLDRRGRVAVAAGAVQLRPVERVVAAELVAHLVGDVVDRVEVADRRRDAGAALRLGRAADDAEVRDAAARRAEREVADVEVAGADDLAGDDPVAREAGAAREVRQREARPRGRTARSGRSPAPTCSGSASRCSRSAGA